MPGMTRNVPPMRSAVWRTVATGWTTSRSPANTSDGAGSGPAPTLVVMNGSIHQFRTSRTARPLSGRRRSRIASRRALGVRSRLWWRIRWRSGLTAEVQNGSTRWTPKAVIASSMEEPLTPQGADGAIRTRACGETRRAAIWLTSPPME